MSHKRSLSLVAAFFLAFLVSSAADLYAQRLCDDNYIKSLPLPVISGAKFHRVIQLINCTDQVLLGATNAAHQIGKPAYPVFPLENTWVMQPFNPNNPADYSNVLTIPIPAAWENTVGKTHHAANAPNIWARTGCQYDAVTNRAVCETGGCNDAYDCSSAGYAASPFTTITEWTFYQPSSNPKIFLDNPDISAVNGTSLTVDIQAIGGDATNPFATDWQWLRYNGHLAEYGQDLRNPTYCGFNSVSQNPAGFLLKRSDINKSGLLKFEIIDQNGNLACLKGSSPTQCAQQQTDYTMSCLNNCGFYKYPSEQGSTSCDPTDPGCLGWQTFCAGNPDFYPPNTYSCSTDQDCADYAIKKGSGPNGVYASCWHNDSTNPTAGFCGARSFYAQDISNCNTQQTDGAYWGSPTETVPCSFTYQSYNPLTTLTDWSTQPPSALCSTVAVGSTPISCIGDDTIHKVLHGAYTWPNDPEVFGADSPVYRIVYGPQAQGGISIPITPSVAGIPLCSNMPDNYKYAQNHQNCSIEIDHEGAVFGIAVANLQKDGLYESTGSDWPCSLDQRGAARGAGVLCRWNPPPAQNCTPPTLDTDVTQSACGRIDSGTSLASSQLTPTQNEPLFVQVSIPQVLNPVNAPSLPTGCASNWQAVPGGTLAIYTNGGYIGWYYGTANTNQACTVTVKLASSNPAELKVYGVPKFNGTIETASSAMGKFLYPSPNSFLQNSVSAGVASTQSASTQYLMLGSLLQVNQQLTPITYWNNWLTNNPFYPGIDCVDPNGNINDNFCPTDDGTDYLPGHGALSANSDSGHQHLSGAGVHALQRAGQTLGSFNWGGVAIYLQLAP